jgi:mannose-6-phosphate isomerase-like protein (cupin superfamily)
MRYIYAIPTAPTFVATGLSCYDYDPLQHEGLQIQYLDVRKGHDTFQISKKITRVYYIASGSGYFTIANNRYDVSEGAVVEVPPGIEYSYSGTMKAIVVSTPRWFRGNDQSTHSNPDVGEEGTSLSAKRSVTERGLQGMGKSLVRLFRRLTSGD